MNKHWLLIGLVCTALVACKGKPRDDGTIKIAAAASLSGAFEAMGDAFSKETGIKVVLSFGSSGKLAQQIENGAPFDLYAPADLPFLDRLIEKKAAIAATRATFARGRIVAWMPKDSKIAPPTTLADLADGRFSKIGLANPEHAPFGRAAKQAFENTGILDQVSTRLVYGSNVRQAMQYAETGNVDIALIALSLALSSDGPYILIDDAQHEPLDNAIVVVSSSRHQDAAAAFIQFVVSPAGQAILSRYGLMQTTPAAPAGK